VARGPVEGDTPVTDDDLFAADREAERRGLEVGVFPTSLVPVDGPATGAAAGELQAGGPPRDDHGKDTFPYARPVEAAAYGDNVERFPRPGPHGERRTA
jgi:hypothetical protein